MSFIGSSRDSNKGFQRVEVTNRYPKGGFMILEFAVSHGIIWLLLHHKCKHSSVAVQNNDAHIPIPKFGD